MSMIQIPVALRGTAPAPFVAEDGGGLVRTSECQVSPFLAMAIGYSREAKPLEPPLVPLMRGVLPQPWPGSALGGDEQRAAADQDDAEAIRRRETLAQKYDTEDSNENNRKLVDWRDAGGLAELQGAKIAKPGSPRGDAGQGKKSIGARRNRGERLKLFGERENRGEDDGNHDRAKQCREIRIDVGDPDFRENRGHGGKNCRQQSPEEPRRGPGLQAAPLSGAASKPA
jgi:hypothetical protein